MQLSNSYQLMLLAVLFFIIAQGYIFIAEKYKIIDTPTNRSSHSLPTIRGGGILFYIAVLLFFVISKLQYPYFIIGVSVIAIVSFIDDLVMLSPKIRLPFQFISVAMLLIELNILSSPFWLVGVLLIIGVGFLNLYNFMDGINGLTGLYSTAVLGTLFFINYQEGIISNQLFTVMLISLGVFGYYNFRTKARFFAGDIGSITMAMLVLFLVVKFILQLESPVLILIVAVYGADSILTIAYRIWLKEPIFQAHRHHIYQKLVDKAQWSHLKVSTVYAIVQLIIGGIVISSYQVSLTIQIGIIVLTSIGLLFCYIVLFNKLKRSS